MNRYFIHLAYNGSNYHGWQIQQNAHTVQAEISDKLSLLLGKAINLVGCGRTDTGVHAKSYYAHFDIDRQIDYPQKLKLKLNSFLPEDIVIYKVFKVAPNLHARFSAISRTYKYYINLEKNPFKNTFSFYYRAHLEIEKMNQAAEMLFEYNDFTSFSKLHSQTETNNCIIKEAVWSLYESELVFKIKADRFLRNMVRAIVGTMVEIGTGKFEPVHIKTIIESKDRSTAGFSVPAEGLFLEDIEYPEK